MISDFINTVVSVFVDISPWFSIDGPWFGNTNSRLSAGSASNTSFACGWSDWTSFFKLLVVECESFSLI